MRVLAVVFTVAAALSAPTLARAQSRDLPTTKVRTAAPVVTPVPPVAERVGVSAHLFWFGRADVEARMAQLKANGMHWLRDDFQWAKIEPVRGTFDWTRTDILMAGAARSGVDVLGVLTYTPPWASSDPSGAGSRNYPPRDPADYARFVAAVAGRYGTGGTFWAQRTDLVARPLKAAELWNEPWYKGYWSPNPDPAAYARLVRAAAAAVPASAKVQLLISADILQVRTDGKIVPWFESLTAADKGILDVVDALSVHPYPQPFSRNPDDTSGDPRWRFDRVPLADQTARAAGRQLPIWITEVGWSTTPNDARGVTEALQAQYTTAAVRKATTTWSAIVARTFVYSLMDSPTEADPFFRGYGLLRADNTAKPAWTALGSLIRGS